MGTTPAHAWEGAADFVALEMVRSGGSGLMAAQLSLGSEDKRVTTAR